MYISLTDSCTKNFRNWSDAHTPKVDKDVRADAADPDINNREMPSPERPHQPWLVHGAGRL